MIGGRENNAFEEIRNPYEAINLDKNDATSSNIREIETSFDWESLIMSDLDFSDLNTESLANEPLVSELIRLTSENDKIIVNDQSVKSNSAIGNSDNNNSKIADHRSAPIQVPQTSMPTQGGSPSSNKVVYYLGKQLRYKRAFHPPFIFISKENNAKETRIVVVNSATGKVSSFAEKFLDEIPAEHWIPEDIKVSGECKIILPNSYVLYRDSSKKNHYYPCVVTLIR